MLYKPFPPLPHLSVRPPALAPGQEEAYETVLEHFSDTAFRVDGESVDEAGKLSDYERYWLSRECILRYLRATSFSPQRAITRLAATLAWRRQYGLYRPTFAEHVEPEGLTGKTLPLGYDTDGRPIMYLRSNKQNTESSDKNLEYLFFMMEGTIELMAPGVESVDLVVSFGEREKSPSLSVARHMLSILQNHYPERLGKCFITDVPWLVSLFFGLFMPLVDPNTRAKVHFNPDLIKEGYIAQDILLRERGGDLDFDYVHEEYWPTWLKLTSGRRKAHMARWRTLGGTVGISEYDYKSVDGTEMDVDDVEPKEQTAEALEQPGIPVSVQA